MPTDSLVLAAVGVLLVAVALFVRVRRRADLLANYDKSADPEYAAVHAGNAVAAAGAVLVAYGAADAYWEFPEWTVFVPILAVVALAFLAAARAQGY
ncbi:uncharacterized protein HHUB_3481 [Halobacterium hubeiense]|uniref:Uncharacterized protein n=2 Tax=Halobacterium TaxID=2239 RepID=A0A0U5H8H9_9EURY|nr:hypothetical protein [Halobacterium hubeiense]CQH61549.1 uncharacterized protein HHUB_3481 [Halobacterium hubeiense]